MNLYSLLDQLPKAIAQCSDDSLGAVMAQLAACQTAVAARLITQYGTPPPPEAAAPLLNVNQIAERLHLVKSRVYELIRQGKLPAVRIGKHVRMEAGCLEQWIAGHRGRGA